MASFNQSSMLVPKQIVFEVVDPKLSVSFIYLLFLFDGEALQLRSYCTAGSILNLLAAQLPEFT